MWRCLVPIDSFKIDTNDQPLVAFTGLGAGGNYQADQAFAVCTPGDVRGNGEVSMQSVWARGIVEEGQAFRICAIRIHEPEFDLQVGR